MKDLYKTLGVPDSADADTIKKAYRKLAKENHPDVTGGDKKKTERFKEINDAYGVLGDDNKRREYERLRRAPVRPDGMPEGFDADSFAEMFGGGGRRAGSRGGRVHVSSNFGDFGDVNDLFANLFGGGGGGGGVPGRTRGGASRAPARGPDLAGSLEVSFREAALGTRRSLRAGTGENIEVAVPPGVETGGRLRVPGKGGPSPSGGPRGDLYLDIVVAPDPHLRRQENDVEIILPLTVGEAILGTKIDVPTVEEPVRMTIPPGTSSGTRLRLRGKGIKRPDGTRGDQIGRVEIVVPRLPSDDPEVRRLIEQLEQLVPRKPVRSF